MVLGPGTTLSHFKILAKIGEGGMGVVYRAEDEKLRRSVALKVLPPHLVANEDRRLRFLREARTAAAVNHPNIATIYEVDEADGVVFIAMELVEGKTLREVIGGQPMSVKETLRIATEMSEGLAKAHGAHVIHRDLKPENVIVTDDGHIKILDFGLAKILEQQEEVRRSQISKLDTISEQLTIQGILLGTPSYMSPEQARGQPVDMRSDVFSFGTTLYEMITGAVPFSGGTATDVLSAIVRDDPPLPSHVTREVPMELDRIVAKCLQKDPQERYQKTDELVNDLRGVNKITDSRVYEVPSRLGTAAASLIQWQWVLNVARKNRTLTVSIGAILFLAALLGAWIVRNPADGFTPGNRMFVAEFESRTTAAEVKTMVGDSFEHMLGKSRYVDVLRGERIKALASDHMEDRFAGINRQLAGTLCRAGVVDGYFQGNVEMMADRYGLGVDVHSCRSEEPLFSFQSDLVPEEELLKAAYEITQDIRVRLGEGSKHLVAAWPPTTRSLRAYKMLAVAANTDNEEEKTALLRMALETDPEFIEARRSLAVRLNNTGDLRQSRRERAEVYRQSSGLPAFQRLQVEIEHFANQYDFDAALERARAAIRIYPDNAWVHHILGWLYPEGYQDYGLAIAEHMKAYSLASGSEELGLGLTILVYYLFLGGDADAIEDVVMEYLANGGREIWADFSLMHAQMLRGDELGVRRLFEGLQGKSAAMNTRARASYLQWLLATGRLSEARSAVSDAYRAAQDAGAFDDLCSAEMAQRWLAMRNAEEKLPFRPEALILLRNNLPELPAFATLSVELEIEEPLKSLIEAHEGDETLANTRFVMEEIAYARGCLAVIQGNGQRAMEILEPLARDSVIPLRRWALGRAYEQRSMWGKAVRSYEEMFRSPVLTRYYYNFPPLWSLAQFRLARLYERLGDRDRSHYWYERFTEDWKDGDPDLPELIEARARLAELKTATSGAEPRSDL